MDLSPRASNTSNEPPSICQRSDVSQLRKSYFFKLDIFFENILELDER